MTTRISHTVLQARHHEVGRIRMGFQQEYQKDGKTKYRAAKLRTFRLTSASEVAIRSVSDVYGGNVTRWEDAPAGTGEQWQVIVDSPFIDFLILPNGFSSAFELWSGGGCERRCDGVEMSYPAVGPCQCDPEARECKATSRLRGLLPLVQVVGAWRLESHGINAAVELAAFADLMAAAEMTGFKIPVRLRIEERSSQKPGQARHDYTVPVPEIAEMTPAQLLGAGVTREEVKALPSGIPNIPRSPIYPGLESGDDVVEGAAVEFDPGPAPMHQAAAESARLEFIAAINGSPDLDLTDAEIISRDTVLIGMTVPEIEALCKKQNVNLAFVNAQAKLIPDAEGRTGRTLPVISPQERLALAQRLLGV